MEQPTPPAQASNDFDTKEITRTVDQHGTDLETIKKGLAELQDKKLDEKICKAIEDSTHIQEKISGLVWKTIREKIVWIILGLAGIVFFDIIKTILLKLLALVIKA
jgi:hypothetical protein